MHLSRRPVEEGLDIIFRKERLLSQRIEPAFERMDGGRGITRDILMDVVVG